MTTLLALDTIIESPLNPRRHFARMDELAGSLRRGQLEPIVVRAWPGRPGFHEVADGARRLRAARAAGLATLEARVLPLTDAEMFDHILGKGSGGNVDPLTPLEEAAGYREAMQHLGLGTEQVAERFARSRTHVHRCLALLELPEAARVALENGALPERTAWLIARIPGAAKREAAAEAVMHDPVTGGVMTSRQAELFIGRQVCRTLTGAPFPVDEADLVPAAGACGECRWRAGNDPATYGDVRNPHTCMNPTCFDAKAAAARGRLLAREARAGKVPLSAEENAAAFLPEGRGLHWRSEYVELNKPIARDLLKPEVSRAPRWRELIAPAGEGEAKAPLVEVRVGVDQVGCAVDLVRLSEALLAVPVAEQAIFSAEALRRVGVRAAKPPGGVSLVAPARRKKAAGETEEGGGPDEETSADEKEAEMPQRTARWIVSVLEAAPELPPGLRSEGRALREWWEGKK